MLLNSARFLAALSCLAFVSGMYFPLAVLMDSPPSGMVYGMVIVSFPAWTIGVLSGGLAGYLGSRAEDASRRLQRFSWVCGAINATAIVASWLWSPAGIS